MLNNIFQLAPQFLHKLDPEKAHDIAISGLSLLPKMSTNAWKCDSLKIQFCNMHFNHPIGLAAGFDKNAQACAGLLNLGFSFIETGTVTPIAQAGNAKPRIFRLPQNKALINRLGFNNDGMQSIKMRLKDTYTTYLPDSGIVGVNIGANKDTSNKVEDYIIGLKTLMPHAHYCTANISSPNTPGLRDLQHEKPLHNLLESLCKTRQGMPPKHQKPLFVKISPDITFQELRSMAHILCQYPIDAVIVSNTTISRPATLISSPHNNEMGGLSGKPLYTLSTQILAQFYLLTEGKIPLIGVGGIRDTHTALDKIKAGATLLQMYTGFIYEGPAIVKKIYDGLKETIKQDNKKHITDYVGIQAEHIAQGS